MTSVSEQEKVIDEWGPEKILQVYDPDTGMKGVLVIDNTSTGPGKGGIRFDDKVTPTEIFRLARTMTWKCALLVFHLEERRVVLLLIQTKLTEYPG